MTNTPRKRRRFNGEGSIVQRKDGRWMARFYVDTTSGARKRKAVYGHNWQEAYDKMRDQQDKARHGVPMPDRSWKLADWLDHWLETSVVVNRRPATYALYETTVRLYLKPGLGIHRLEKLSVPILQAFFNHRLRAGDSVRGVQVMRTVLSSALTAAVRAELLTRNVAQLVELPAWERGHIEPWTVDEAKNFLLAARGDPLYPGFVLLLLYGMRRGEVLGLRWRDIDFDTEELYVRYQLQRVRGELILGPIKTSAGRRKLPLLGFTRDVLKRRQKAQAAHRERLGRAWTDTGLVFTTRTGRPVEPRNFVRSFRRICDEHGIRVITVHHVRHTTATLLKNLGVPARDAQLILGHARISTTQEIYGHEDDQARWQALGRISDALEGKTTISRRRRS